MEKEWTLWEAEWEGRAVNSVEHGGTILESTTTAAG